METFTGKLFIILSSLVAGIAVATLFPSLVDTNCWWYVGTAAVLVAVSYVVEAK